MYSSSNTPQTDTCRSGWIVSAQTRAFSHEARTHDITGLWWAWAAVNVQGLRKCGQRRRSQTHHSGLPHRETTHVGIPAHPCALLPSGLLDV